MKTTKQKTKFKMTPARYYNHLEDKGDRLLKSSIHSDKIQAEINYYKDLSQDLKEYHPEFLGESKEGQWETGYLIEKIPSCDFGQIFTGLCESEVDSSMVLQSLGEYFETIPKKELSHSEWSDKLERLVLLKNERRLTLLKGQSYFREIEKVFKRNGWESMDSFMDSLNRRARKMCDEKNQKYTVWKSHGDLCFSNLIPFSNHLYLVDPRGVVDGEDGLLPSYYDLAKISQCLLGGYDFINNEVNYTPRITLNGPLVAAFKEFLERFEQSYELTRIFEVSHFFSMLPLHISSPKKVLAFSKNAIDLFEEFR